MDRLPGSLHNFIAHLAGLEVNSSAGRCGPWSTWGVWSKKAPCWDLPSLLFMKSSWLAFKIPSKRIQFAVSWCGVVPQGSISFGRTSDFYNGTCRCSWHFPYFLIALSVRILQESRQKPSKAACPSEPFEQQLQQLDYSCGNHGKAPIHTRPIFGMKAVGGDHALNLERTSCDMPLFLWHGGRSQLWSKEVMQSY